MSQAGQGGGRGSGVWEWAGAAIEEGGSPLTATLPGCPASTSEESWTDSEVDSSCSGQPIHLWQFLKELLLKPHSYGRFIRWLNKEKGEQCQGQEGRGLLGACGPARRWAGRVGGRAEGWSCPHLCPECHTRTLTGPAQGLCAVCVHTCSRAGLCLLRVPSDTQCLGHSRALELC